MKMMTILESVLNRNITLNQQQNLFYSYKANILLQLLFQYFKKCLLSVNTECSSSICSTSSLL